MRATKLNLSVLLGFMVFIIACGSYGSAQKKRDGHTKEVAANVKPPENQDRQESEKKDWLDYAPAIVELEGKLGIKTFFGPPNFGENPETDSKERSWILSLDKPINVRGQTGTDPGLNASAEDVRELQLVLTKPHRELINKKVIVKGTLFHAHTGHHHTDILMDVQSIAVALPEI